MHGAEGDGEAVPRVDGAEEERELDEFSVGELRAHRGIVVVGRVSFRDEGERLGPGEGSALARGVER